MRYRISRRAQADIREIGRYIARDNPDRAVTYVDELQIKCRSLLDFPEAAPLRPALGNGIREAILGRYLIFYVVNIDLLEIRRILHGARDIGPDEFSH